MNIFHLILSLLIPPLGVFLKVGANRQFWLNVLLTLLGYLPGVVHAGFVLTTDPEPDTITS